MDRYSFDEIKNFKNEDVFWAHDGKYTVISENTRYSTTNFNGETSEKIEWDAVSEKTGRPATFQVSNTKGVGNSTNQAIYKTPAKQSKIEGFEHEIVYSNRDNE